MTTTHPQDLQVQLPHRPDALADLTEALSNHGVNLEGGGIFTLNGRTVAHYLVDNGPAALTAVTTAGLGRVAVRDVLITRLDQNTPGQLATLTRLLAHAGIPLQAQYSDHAGNLILLVPEPHIPTCRRTLHHWETTHP